MLSFQLFFPMSSRTRKLCLGLACLSLATVAGAVPALAQGTTVNTSGYPAACSAESVTKAQSDKAHDVFKIGKQQYDDNNHELAINLFKDAYTRDCSKHELLIIISRSYELKGDKAEAVRALEIFLQRDPTNSDAETYRRRIKQMRDSLVVAPPPTATPAPTATQPPPPKGEDRGHTPYPWILVGVGGAAVVAGIVLLATAPALPPGCSTKADGKDTCDRVEGESAQAYKARQDQAGSAKNNTLAGGIVAGAGGAVLVAGLLWHILEPTGPETSAKPKLRPETGPGYAGLSFGGSF